MQRCTCVAICTVLCALINIAQILWCALQLVCLADGWNSAEDRQKKHSKTLLLNLFLGFIKKIQIVIMKFLTEAIYFDAFPTCAKRKL